MTEPAVTTTETTTPPGGEALEYPVDAREEQQTEDFFRGRGIDTEAVNPSRRGVMNRNEPGAPRAKPAARPTVSDIAGAESEADLETAPPSRRVARQPKPEPQAPRQPSEEPRRSERDTLSQGEEGLLRELVPLEGDDEPEGPVEPGPDETEQGSALPFTDQELESLGAAAAALAERASRPITPAEAYARRNERRGEARIDRLEQAVTAIAQALQSGGTASTPARETDSGPAPAGQEPTFEVPEDFFENPGPAMQRLVQPLVDQIAELRAQLDGTTRQTATDRLFSWEQKYEEKNPGYFDRTAQATEVRFRELLDLGVPEQLAREDIANWHKGFLILARRYNVAPMVLADREARRILAFSGVSLPPAAPAGQPAPAAPPARRDPQIAAAVAASASPAASSLGRSAGGGEESEADSGGASLRRGSSERETVRKMFAAGGRQGFLAQMEREEAAIAERRRAGKR